jgi:cytidylate kinase
VKFYLDADFEERARRRLKELEEKEERVEAEKLKQELKERDTKDLTRPVGPLKKARDAVAIDSTHLTVEEVVARMMGYIKGHKVKESQSHK